MKKISAILVSVLASFLAGCWGNKVGAPRAFDLRIGPDFVNPVGFSLEDNSLSWKIPFRKGAAQTAYRIQVLSGGKIVADTGKVVSDASARVENPLKETASRQKVSWRVKFWDENGAESDWSEYATYEAGLLKNSDWKGKWIFSPEPRRELYKHRWAKVLKFIDGIRRGVPPTYLRKTFEIPAGKSVKSARLYVASKGIFQASINGKKVGNDFWGTGWTDYKKRIQTNTYDVSKMLKSGNNAVCAIIADGWYSGRIQYRDRNSFYSQKPEFLAQLEIVFEDGSSRTIATDSSWKAAFGGILYADIYDGESFDANLEPTGWQLADFDDSSWKPAAAGDVDIREPYLQPRRNQPIVVKQIVSAAPQKISDGVFRFDFEQNLVGVPKIVFKGKKGATATIRYAEMLQKNGELYTANYRTAESTDRYTFASDKPETFVPVFTYHGYRYLEISGLPADTKPADVSAQALVMYNDMPISGGFVCSIPIVNRLQSNIVWGQRSNYFSVPTDCPQRDERMGWLGDAQVFAPTAAFNMNVDAFFQKWMFDVDDAQRDSRFSHVAPGGWGSGSPAWSDAGVICPWEMYLAYGDKKILEQHHFHMTSWVRYVLKNSENFVRVVRHAFGDWLQPSTTRGSDSSLWRGNTPYSLIGTAYFYKCAKIMEKTSRILGLEDDAAEYAEIAGHISRAFVREFVKPDGTVATNTQTGYLLALDFDILPENLRRKSFEKLVEKLESDNWYLDTGFVGTPLLNRVLSRFGRHDIAVRLLLNEEYPSWLYSIKQGATTMWERWNSYSHKDGFGSAAMNSFNHYSYGAVGEWMYRSIGGIAPDPENAGYKNIIFAPKLSQKINSAHVFYETPYGRAESSWKIARGEMSWNITVPPNATATVEFPAENADSVRINGEKPESLRLEKLGCGEYQITITKPKY